MLGQAVGVKMNKLSRGLKAGVTWYPCARGSVCSTAIPILEKRKLKTQVNLLKAVYHIRQ